MFSYVKDFFSRHKKKFIFSGVVVGGVILGSSYAKQKFTEWQDRETKLLLERTMKQHYFESTEKTCTQTITSLGKTLRKNINDLVKCEEVLDKLREDITPSDKVGLWNDLKVLVFTKVSLFVYAGVLITIALRIQLNIIGGYIFRSSQAAEGETKIKSSLQEKYLSKCHHFLDSGIKELCMLVKEKVYLALKDVGLKQSMTLQNVENIFWAIQSSIDSDSRNPLKSMPNLLFGKEMHVSENVINEMLIDTFDLLESAEVKQLALSCISHGFSNVVDTISVHFLPCFEHGVSYPSTSKQINNVIKYPNSTNLAKPFAKIIPIINAIGRESDSTESWLTPFICMERVQMLGANIYESYSSSEIK